MFQAVAQKAPSAQICVLDVLSERGWIEVVINFTVAVWDEAMQLAYIHINLT